MNAKGKLIAIDIGYTDNGCKLTLEWKERINLEGAISPMDLSRRSVDLIQRVLEAALAAVRDGVAKDQISPPIFGEPS